VASLVRDVTYFAAVGPVGSPGSPDAKAVGSGSATSPSTERFSVAAAADGLAAADLLTGGPASQAAAKTVSADAPHGSHHGSHPSPDIPGPDMPSFEVANLTPPLRRRQPCHPP
jgi:hypothetical protein